MVLKILNNRFILNLLATKPHLLIQVGFFIYNILFGISE